LEGTPHHEPSLSRKRFFSVIPITCENHVDEKLRRCMVLLSVLDARIFPNGNSPSCTGHDDRHIPIHARHPVNKGIRTSKVPRHRSNHTNESVKML
jgi:hypothetical protein